MSRVKELESLIKTASFKYYSGEPLEMSDVKFDSLVDELRSLDPDNFIVNTPGFGYVTDNSKFRHLGVSPVGSLGKYSYPDPVKAPNTCLVMPKLDGCSVVVYSDNGVVTAGTRSGDGTVGVDCTNKILDILERDNPVALKWLKSMTGIIGIRGEVMLKSESIPDLLASGDIALRNISNGLMNRKDVAPELKHVTFIPYFIRVSSFYGFSSHMHMLEFLAEMGFSEVPWNRLVDVDSWEPKDLKSFFDVMKDALLIDGLVISYNHEFPDGITDYSSYESNQVAYKFQQEGLEGVVERVEWATGSVGRLAPVCVLQAPLELEGAFIQRVSLHHALNVKEKCIGPGAVVKIRRANGVIPFLEEVIKPGDWEANWPKTCPACGSDKIEMDGTYLVCQSDDCTAKTIVAIKKFLEVCGIPKGLGGTTIDAWLDEFPVNMDYSKISDIFQFIAMFSQSNPHNNQMRNEILQKKFGYAYGNLLFKMEVNIEENLAKGIQFKDFWYLLNMSNLSTESAKKLGKVDPRILSSSEDIPADLHGSGVSFPVLKVLSDRRGYWRLGALRIPLRETEATKEEKIILKIGVTGSVSIPRKDWINRLKDLGIQVRSVGKDTKYLVSNEESGSSKTVAAQKLGVKVVTESDFYTILADEYGISEFK